MRIRRALAPDAAVLRECLWMAIQASPTLLRQIPEPQLLRQEDLYWGRWDCESDPAWVAEALVQPGTSSERDAVPPRTLEAGGLGGDAVPLRTLVVGGGVLLKLKSDGVYRLGIAVHARSRRAGLGQRLLEVAQQHAAQEQRPLELLVDPENQGALHLYLRTGFEPSGEEQDILRMRWRAPGSGRA